MKNLRPFLNFWKRHNKHTTGIYHNLFHVLLLGGVLISACNGQVDNQSTQKPVLPAKPIPVVMGTPPPLIPSHNPYNDTNLVSQYVRSIFQDSKGNFWFGPAGQSVVRYDEKTLNYYSKAEFFRGNSSIDQDYGNSVHAITEDRNGNIWFGTDHGAIKFDGKNFKSYTEESGLGSTRVGRRSILVDTAGDIWIGTQEGVFRYIPSADSINGQCFSSFHLLPAIKVNDIMEDDAGNIWFASRDSGIFRYDGKAIKSFTGPKGIGVNAAGGIAQDKMGHMWFTMQGGICRYDGKDFKSYTTNDGIGGSEVWGIFIERSGIIWVTSRGSTTRFDPSLPVASPKAFTVFTVEDGLNCCVQSMYQDQMGNMWWGTGQGLYRFDGERFYQVKQTGPW